jgi:hypothetical protein
MPRGWFAYVIRAFVCWAASVLVTSAAASQLSDAYYLNSGTTLKIVEGDPTHAEATDWQVWLYPHAASVSRYGGALLYARWGVIHAHSARAVMEQLATLQEFERAYTIFFGSNAWGRFTFSYPIGPIAVANKDSPAVVSEADLLTGRLTPLIQVLLPSLRNGERGDAAGSVRAYFQQVRDCLASIDQFYDKAFRLPEENSYLLREFSRLPAAVSRAESVVPKVRAVLPSVTLPASRDWMSQTAREGSDGTMAVTVTESDSGAVVRQSWTGGDGSMSGTVIQTVVSYRDIGNLHVSVPSWIGKPRWTVQIQAASQRGFSQSLTSPERKTAKHTYAPVNLKTSAPSVYLEFSSPADAQNAYTFFLYHSQRGP